MFSASRIRPFVAAVAAAGLLLSACGDDASTSTESAMAGSSMSDHDHGLYEVPDGVAVPSLSIEVEPDTKAGANLFVEVDDFIIAPEHASTEPVAGEGHFHAYVDGKKVARFYNQALHLKLGEGEHTVMVELSANNHAPYAVDGEPITATATVDVPAATMSHAHDPVEAAAPVPTVSLSHTVDPKMGWNLFADITDFEFAPRQAGLDNQDGAGHLHLYVDGEKVGRLYGPGWHLSGLSAGTHEVTVELNANSHAPYTAGGSPIVASTTIEVSEDQAADAMAMGSDEMSDEGHEHDDDHGMGEGVELLDMAAADADTVITVSVAGGKVEIDDNRVKVDEGSTVGLVVTSDEADRVHVPGYEIIKMVDPSMPVDIAFTADSSGVFEVELEDTGLFLFDLQVS